MTTPHRPARDDSRMAGRDGTDGGTERSAGIRGDDLLALGMTEGPALGLTLAAGRRLAAADGRDAALAAIAAVVREPAAHLDDPRLGGVARALAPPAGREPAAFAERDAPAPWASFCVDAEAGALAQMAHAMRLPVVVTRKYSPYLAGRSRRFQ